MWFNMVSLSNMLLKISQKQLKNPWFLFIRWLPTALFHTYMYLRCVTKRQSKVAQWTWRLREQIKWSLENVRLGWRLVLSVFDRWVRRTWDMVFSSFSVFFFEAMFGEMQTQMQIQAIKKKNRIIFCRFSTSSYQKENEIPTLFNYSVWKCSFYLHK